MYSWIVPAMKESNRSRRRMHRRDRMCAIHRQAYAELRLPADKAHTYNAPAGASQLQSAPDPTTAPSPVPAASDGEAKEW